MQLRQGQRRVQLVGIRVVRTFQEGHRLGDVLLLQIRPGEQDLVGKQSGMAARQRLELLDPAVLFALQQSTLGAKEPRFVGVRPAFQHARQMGLGVGKAFFGDGDLSVSESDGNVIGYLARESLQVFLGLARLALLGEKFYIFKMRSQSDRRKLGGAFVSGFRFRRIVFGGQQPGESRIRGP